MIGLLITSVVAIFAICFYFRFKLTYWKRRGVQQLSNTSYIFGNFKDAVLFRTAPGWHMGELYRSAKSDLPYVGFYIFHKPCLLIRDPKIIKQMLVKDFDNFSDRHFAGSVQKDSIGMRNLFGLKNPAWRYLRTKISPTLTRNKLKQMFPLMTETAQPMEDHLRKQNCNQNSSTKVDVQELNYIYTTDLIANVALGTKLNSFDNPNTEFCKAAKEFFHSFKRMVALVTVFFMPELVEKIGSTMLFNSEFVKKIFWDAVDSRERTKVIRGDFIDSLVELKNIKQNPIYKFEGDNLLYQSGTFFSGFESSSTTATFTLMELARKPECQEKARNDILSAIEKHGWTYDAFNDMKYLDKCVAEGVRLHPSVSTIDRYTKNDYQIPGTDVIVERGTPIYISLYGLQQDERYFKNPDVFDPDRHIENRSISEAYIPFGIGPRMCVGMRVGQMHAKIAIATILKEYRISQKAEEKNELDSRSTFTAAANGINLEFMKLII
ncbi:Cytochrome P450 6k1 [Pseudolycoriella hygida]|uniref:Cytochrome P450 6k1 n=1 Tax=Pseudolycoriella hygida TaxID=35572 RepID=A0A9Q0N986_9DIPT|nr:Cytochrome P450 6k1 [Pseudolycoriella hygida]